MKLHPPQLFETDRLIVEACKVADAKDLFNNYTSSEIASEYLQRKPHKELAQTEKFVTGWGGDNWGKQDGKYAWSIKEKSTGKAFGVFILIVEDGIAEIHFGVQPEMSGHGFATEAGLPIVSWLKNMSPINKISTICDAEHISSGNVLSKLGLKRVELLKKFLLLPSKGEQKRDAWLYVWNK